MFLHLKKHTVLFSDVIDGPVFNCVFPRLPQFVMHTNGQHCYSYGFTSIQTLIPPFISNILASCASVVEIPTWGPKVQVELSITETSESDLKQTRL